MWSQAAKPHRASHCARREPPTTPQPASLCGMADWKAAGRRIAIERARRYRDRGDFADATGLSKRVLEDLETGRRRSYAPATLAAVERVLSWEPGTCQELADGAREPRYGIGGTDLRAIIDAWPRIVESDRQLLASIARERSQH